MYSNNPILFAAADAAVPLWDGVLDVILMIVFSLIAIVVVMTFAGLSVVAERKVCAFMQGRYGPNRTAIPWIAAIPGVGTVLRSFGLMQLVADALIALCGGYRKLWAVLLGVAIYDAFGRLIGLAMSFLMARENVGMVGVGAVIVAFGYLGCLLVGLPCGAKFVKELRHAGIIREL